MSFRERIQSASAAKDDEALFSSLAEVFAAGPKPDLVPILSALLLESWHQQHEDIALMLQELKDARAVDSLLAAATMKFNHLLEWNNLSEFQRKCTWALADIGTAAAHRALVQLSKNQDSVLSQFATERLENWGSELNRKGGHL